MEEHRIEHEIDVFTVRRAARELARELGFDRVACLEIAIAASELCSNVLKYGVRGRARIERVEHPERGVGIRVVASDQGPPFRDFTLAMRDGFDDQGRLDPAKLIGRRGIGAGLGTVKRFSDELCWEPTPGGKEVRLTRYLRRPAGRGGWPSGAPR